MWHRVAWSGVQCALAVVGRFHLCNCVYQNRVTGCKLHTAATRRTLTARDVVGADKVYHAAGGIPCRPGTSSGTTCCVSFGFSQPGGGDVMVRGAHDLKSVFSEQRTRVHTLRAENRSSSGMEWSHLTSSFAHRLLRVDLSARVALLYVGYRVETPHAASSARRSI